MEETKNTRKEWDKTYRAKHKEQIKQYRDDNKDAKKEYNKEYKEDHKEQIQKYRDANIDHIKQHCSDYNKTRITCDHCGTTVCKGYLSVHRKTAKCKSHINT